jgi:hypothetical protein
LQGCTTPVVTPREYLDEQTAATITVVADPWIFTSEQFGASLNDRDYLNVFAIDVNRMGNHRQYLAVQQSAPPATLAGTAVPTLELQGGGQTLLLQPAVETARQLGISKPLAPAYSGSAKWWYFPVDKQVLSTVGRAKDLRATLIASEQRLAYTMWRDGSEEIAELTAVLP